ncbi:hypothetical protein L6452_38316 [Arctium lappa]|uniref:Uncharacterized protein n=1 Tax=Arctium lappa TaxID=4217 RepID=A0ACB8Y602_ARCLA|nr:hypothetical protein L6452_38316 [Arctium lappa]
MVKCVEAFTDYFDQKTIELILGTHQAAALVLFIVLDRLGYSEIKTWLNLGDEDAVRLLHLLSCSKYTILTKEPSTKSVSRTGYFQFNSKFAERMRRIKIPLPPLDEKKKIVEEVNKDR